MHKVLTLVLMTFLFVACGHRKDAKSFEAALEEKTGHAYSIVKLHTETGNYVVYKDEVTGRYSAYNMDKWDRKTMTSIDQFMKSAVSGVDFVMNLAKIDEWVQSGYYEDVYDTYEEEYEYYDEDCDCYYTETYTYTEKIGEEWVDTSHWYTFYSGGGFRFDNTSSQSKDLETIAAIKEEAAEKFMAYKLGNEFSLSEGRASELAKLASRYQKLENARELTSAEKDKFALDALGVSFSQVESALKQKAQGREEAYEKLLATASEVNKTTPEQIGKFFNELVIDQVVD